MTCVELVDAAAVFRITRFVTADHLSRRARRWVIRVAYRRQRRDGVQPTAVFLDADAPEEAVAVDDTPPFAAKLVTCPWCLSVWVAVGVVAARRLAPRVWHPAAVALAASAFTGLVAERSGAGS